MAEVGIFVLANCGRALMDRAHVLKKYRYRVFPLSMEVARVTDWLLMNEKDGVKKPKILIFGDVMPRFVDYLRTFGEAGVATIKGTMHPKPHDCGITRIFAGYCVN